MYVMQMDEERERRRMRDRQRRQSMSVEQRERHLARRRRNYQLRRLRSETDTHLDTLSEDPGFESGGEMVNCDEYQGPIDDDIAPVSQEKMDSIILESACQETSCQRSSGRRKTIRLSRIRCLARSLSRSEGTMTVVMSKSNVDNRLRFGGSDSRRLLGEIRLIRVKSLARRSIIVANESDREIRRGEQDPVVEETLVDTSPMFGQPIITGNEDKTTLL